ncbi:MAG TPA: hypothetical protein VFU13_02035 [Steroidobacteraceae bacterium]|nr:hypothetical protein [Steroidobacteraceae bacterium]
MAHFVNDKGARISNAIVKWNLESQPLTIGVWGAAGLKVGPNDPSAATIKPLGSDKNNISWFSLKGMRVCNVMVEAVPTSGGKAWDYFQLAISPKAPSTQEIARGAAAALKAVELLRTGAYPVIATDQSGAKVTIRPMTTWAGNRYFITEYGGRVAFIMGNVLYTQPTGDFIRDQYLAAMGTGGAKAAWLETVGQAQMVFFTAFAGGFIGVAATIAAITVGIGKTAASYSKHRNEVHQAAAQIGPILTGLAYIATNCPVLFKIMAKNAPSVLKPNITANDAAYFLGQFLGGIAGAPQVSISVVAFALAKALTLTDLLRGPMLTVRGSDAKSVQQLKDEARKVKFEISDEDARAVLTSPCARDAAVRAKAEDLQKRVEQVRPTLERLGNTFRIESGI